MVAMHLKTVNKSCPGAPSRLLLNDCKSILRMASPMYTLMCGVSAKAHFQADAEPRIGSQPQLVQQLRSSVHWRGDRCIDDRVRPTGVRMGREAWVKEEVATGFQHRCQPRLELLLSCGGIRLRRKHQGSMP